MRLRAVQLACLVVLFSSMSAARGATLGAGEFSLAAHYMGSLLAQDHATTALDAPAHRTGFRCQALPSAAEALTRTVWSVRPPAMHSAAVHAHSGTEI